MRESEAIIKLIRAAASYEILHAGQKPELMDMIKSMGLVIKESIPGMQYRDIVKRLNFKSLAAPSATPSLKQTCYA